MSGAVALLVWVTSQRIIELGIATRNTARLMARGAYEIGADHYPLMVGFHAAWLATLWVFGWSHTLAWSFVLVFFGLQVARAWVLSTLGIRWTTRIIIVPNAPRIISGPYRFLAHPNYAIVALEIPCVSLALGLVWHAVAFGLLNFAILSARIRVENAGLP